MWYAAHIADAIRQYAPSYGFTTEVKSFDWQKLIKIDRHISKEFIPLITMYSVKIMLMSYTGLQNLLIKTQLK